MILDDVKFLGLSLQQYGDLNSVLSLLLLGLTIFIFILYLINSNTNISILKKIFSNYNYNIWLLIVIVFVGISVFGANVYQYVFGDLPCEYCWYQRVLIYPMLFIAIAEVFFRTYKAHLFVMMFASMNFFLASYHYYYHYMRYVKHDILSLPCSTNPLIPNCTEAKVVSFGFMTMPLMSAILGLFVLTITYIFIKTNRKTL